MKQEHEMTPGVLLPDGQAGRQQAVPSVCPRCLGKGSYPGVYGKHACNCSAPAERVEPKSGDISDQEWINAGCPSEEPRPSPTPAVYQCPRCSTSMQIDEEAKPAPAAPDVAGLVEALEGLMRLESRGRVMPVGAEWDAARQALAAFHREG